MDPRTVGTTGLLTQGYRGASVALLTQHGKERVIGPAFESALAARVRLVGDFDTDSLGTFTREIPRKGSQIEAARTKARIGIERSGLVLGLGSEGAFGPGPLGLVSLDVELVVLVDAARGIEVVGRAQAPAQHVRAEVGTREELVDAARAAGFPGHGVVLSTEGDGVARACKGLRAWPSLEAAFDELRSTPPHGPVFLENDLRAHMNPTRMATIAAATADLLERLLRACPACRSPGYGSIAKRFGRPCRDCASPTHEVLAEEYGCVACGHRELRRVEELHGDPASCDVCNP
ncbi:MAG: DUF6671 family protein [Planctomycetota bacterium]